MVELIIRERNKEDKHQLMLQIMNIAGEICNVNLPLLEWVKIHMENGEVKIRGSSDTTFNMNASKVFINLDFADLMIYEVRITDKDNNYYITCNKRLDLKLEECL